MKRCERQRALPERAVRAGIFALFALLLGIGLLVTPDYGQHVDENNQFVLVHANLKEYLLHLTPGERRDELLAWYEAQGIVEISQSENRDHGVALYYPASLLLLTGQISHGLMVALWNGYTFLLFFCGVAALYGIGKLLFDRRLPGLAAALAYYLTPRMFAEGHYNNKDVVLLSAALVSFWLGLRFVKRGRLRDALWMGVAAAFAANIKIAGAWPFGLAGLWYLWELTRKKQWSGKRFALGAAAVGAFLVCYVLITPACWSDPAGYLAYLTGNAQHFARWDGAVLFDGRLYRHSENPLPRLYLLRMMGMTIPPFLLVFAGIGQGFAIADLLRRDRPESAALWLLISLWWIVPIGFAMAARVLVYNSWRHFYFCYGAVILLAVYGAERASRAAGGLLAKWAKRRGAEAGDAMRRLPAAVYGLFALGLFVTALSDLAFHPYQYAYFNVLAGKDTAQRYEIDYWAVGGRSALETLDADLQRAGSAFPVKVSSCDLTTLIGVENGWFNLPAAARERLCCVDDWREADYILINPSYTAIETLSGNPDGQSVLETGTQIDAISAYGSPVWLIYRRAETGEQRME